VIVSYRCNKELYLESEKDHATVLVTTEYSCGDDVFVHLQLDGNYGIRLNNLLNYAFKQDLSFSNEQFLHKKSHYDSDMEIITRDVFEERLKRFEMGKITVRLEVLKEYGYVNKLGQSDNVHITVIVKDESMTAAIDFRDAEQCGNFVCPAWLTELS